MRKVAFPAVLAASLLLVACGGGGGIASTPAPTPTPTPANTFVTDLQANQTFQTLGASTDVRFDLNTSSSIGGTLVSRALTISYDAAVKSYTVSFPGTSKTFTPGDIQTPVTAGETRYKKTGSSGNDYLTLVTTPYSANTSNKYVGLGYFQQNAVASSTQSTSFDAFVYGFATPNGAVPRSGTGKYATDVFGFATFPGYQPSSFVGRGAFTTDFGTGEFLTQTSVTETNLVTGSSVVGGGLEVSGSGRLATDGSFSGSALYGGQNGRIAGTLSGKFFGPGAEELGASFSGSTAAGATVTGAITAQRDTSLPNVNLTMANLVAAQLFYPVNAHLTVLYHPSTGAIHSASTYQVVSQFNYKGGGAFDYSPGLSNLAGGALTEAMKVTAPDANFIRYQTSFGGTPVTLDLYKPSGANSELALSYATFGHWSSTFQDGFYRNTTQSFFTYGLDTSPGLLAARTGTATYRGIAYGAGANAAAKLEYDIKGSSRFDVDFTAQKFTALLALQGVEKSGASADFGSYNFAGNLSQSTRDSEASYITGGGEYGILTMRFFGPQGDEVGGPFKLTVPPGSAHSLTFIQGIALGKR